MVLDTRKNLNSGKFEQVSGDTLNLSGSTNIYKDIVVKSSGDLTIEKYSGTTNKMLEVGLNGIVVANSDIVSGKIVNPVTIGLLTDDNNWSVNGNYIGFDIIDTYEGQYYKDDNYYYFAYSDNSWSRVSLKTLTKENVIGLTLNDNPTFSGITISSFTGNTDRMVQSDSDGMLNASIPIITGKLSDSIAISQLVNSDNWDVNGGYIGPPIVDTFEGQYYRNSIYYYFAYDDNDWIRLLRS